MILFGKFGREIVPFVRPLAVHQTPHVFGEVQHAEHRELRERALEYTACVRQRHRTLAKIRVQDFFHSGRKECTHFVLAACGHTFVKATVLPVRLV